jgi:hypothetical protein
VRREGRCCICCAVLPPAINFMVFYFCHVRFSVKALWGHCVPHGNMNFDAKVKGAGLKDTWNITSQISLFKAQSLTLFFLDRSLHKDHQLLITQEKCVIYPAFYTHVRFYFGQRPPGDHYYFSRLVSDLIEFKNSE